MIKSENKIQRQIINYIKELEKQGFPIFYERRQAGGFNYKKGRPDLFIVYKGIHIEVELKREGGHQSSMQEKFQKKCEGKYNCPYICCCSLDEFINFLRNYM